jgi:hypothetical protein
LIGCRVGNERSVLTELIEHAQVLTSSRYDREETLVFTGCFAK